MNLKANPYCFTNFMEMFHVIKLSTTYQQGFLYLTSIENSSNFVSVQINFSIIF